MSTENTSDVRILNTYSRTEATDFWEMPPCSDAGSKCQKTYVSTDPRTKDFYNNTMIPFDRPPYQVTINGFKFDDLYNNPTLGKSMQVRQLRKCGLGKLHILC